MKVAVSGLVREATGIGVVQRRLYPRLEQAGHRLVYSQSREPRPGRFGRIGGLLRGLSGRDLHADVLLTVVPPLPLSLRVPVVTIVHDLRWQRTRSGLSKWYRAWDLHRTVRRSDLLVCISDRTRSDLEHFDTRAVGKTRVAWEGAGLVSDIPDAFLDGVKGSVLLIGGAAHKRNELAARVLADRPSWCTSVIGVGLSDEAEATIRGAYPRASTFHGRVTDDELVEIYKSAHYFLFLGVEEGFGLPYIEALAAGCVVVAVDQELTRELLGDAAVLITDGDETAIRGQLSEVIGPEREARRRRSLLFSWENFTDIVEDALRRAVGERVK